MTKRNKEEEVKDRIFSKVLPGGEILETVLDKSIPETYLAVGANGKFEILENYTDSEGVEWFPASISGLITKEIIKMPSHPEPFNDLKGLFMEVKKFISEFVSLPIEFYSVASVYVLMTWVFDRFQTIPYLRVLGDFGTGKTRFLQVVGNLCYKPMLAGGSISTAAIFRIIDLTNGTLVFDEADFKNSENSAEIIKILNAGHTTDFAAFRINVNKKDGTMDPQGFSVFGPKILASRNRFSDEALESRCLTQHLLPMNKSRKPIHLPSDFKERSCEIRNKLLAFRMSEFHNISTDEKTVSGVDFPRLCQSALAITSIASKIGQEVLSEISSYLKNYETELQGNISQSVEADILQCVIELVGESTEKLFGQIHLQKIADKFTDKFYDEYSKKYNYYDTYYGPVSKKRDEISAKKIAHYIKNMGIKTERGARGYFIPIPQQLETIKSLARRYGLEFDQNTKKPAESEVKEVTEDIPF